MSHLIDFLRKHNSEENHTHYTLNGIAGGKFKIEGDDDEYLQTKMFNCFSQRSNDVPPMVQLRTEDVDKLIIDADFGKRQITNAQSEQLALWLTETVLHEDVKMPDRANYSDKQWQKMHTSILLTREDASPNVHLAFPGFLLSQRDAIGVLCQLPRRFFAQRGKLSGFEDLTYDEACDILDVCVVTTNGMRMPGAPKVDANRKSLTWQSAYWPSKFIRAADRENIIVKTVPNMMKAQLYFFKESMFGNFKPGSLPVARLNSTMMMDAARFSEQRLISEGVGSRGEGFSPESLLGLDDTRTLLKTIETVCKYPCTPPIKKICVGRDHANPSDPGDTRALPEMLHIILDTNKPGGKWCPNKEAEHKSVGLYGTVKLNGAADAELAMRCHCRCRSNTCFRWRPAPVKLKLTAHLQWGKSSGRRRASPKKRKAPASTVVEELPKPKNSADQKKKKKKKKKKRKQSPSPRRVVRAKKRRKYRLTNFHVPVKEETAFMCSLVKVWNREMLEEDEEELEDSNISDNDIDPNNHNLLVQKRQRAFEDAQTERLRAFQNQLEGPEEQLVTLQSRMEPALGIQFKEIQRDQHGKAQSTQMVGRNLFDYIPDKVKQKKKFKRAPKAGKPEEAQADEEADAVEDDDGVDPYSSMGVGADYL